MSGRITNVNGSRVGLLQCDLSEGETSGTFILSVRPAVNYFLKATPSDLQCEIQSRRTTSGDPFQDIAASPIDLSALTPETPVSYDFRIVVTAVALGDVRRAAFFISAQSAGAVAW